MNKGQAAIIAGAAAAAAVLLGKVERRGRAIDLDGAVVLITGGSRGLGLLLAREIGRRGARVVLAARDEAELLRAREDLHARHVEATVVSADVATEVGARLAVEGTVAVHGRLDVLINNAGVIQSGPVEHMTVADFEEAMAVHFWGPLHAMSAAVPHMRRAGGGRIVNISSIGGRIGVPHLAPYCASKFALTGLSTSMRAELAADKILITTVCPGLMRTGSPINAWFKGRHREEFAWFAIADSLPLMSIDGRRAAWQIVDALRHGDPELVISLPAKLAIVAAAIAPNTFARALSMITRALPPPTEAAGVERYRGDESQSRWAPSLLTRLSDRAAVENNELHA